MVSILNKRSVNHPNWCEDNYFILEDDNKIVGAVLDGCSSGSDTYWASKTFSYVFRALIKDWNNFQVFNISTSNWDNYANELFVDFSSKLKVISDTLSLDNSMELLSTIVFFVYHKENQKLYVKFLGDGAFFYKSVDGEKTILVINDENNMPLYLGYYFDNPQSDFQKYLQTRVNYEINGVERFAISTDGIFSFNHNKLTPSEKKPIEFLIEDDYLSHLKSGLSRKFNILSKDGWVIEDDLTIIRYQ